MVTIDKNFFTPDLTQRLKNLDDEINKFRQEGPLDQLSNEKLEEYFKTQHVFHSAGIEGNRLTLQETMLVLKDGITISEKSIKDTVEVKNLGIAFDFFYELAQQDSRISENYIKQIHKLLVGDDIYLNAGNYRNIGVVITGSEHTPPEPFEVPFKMHELVNWINESIDKENPIILAAVAHHELAKIHPFNDGNGRSARLLLNLILMKKGYPICSIKRTERPRYYEAMSLADKGYYHQIVELVAESCTDIFNVYVRIREESRRKTEWAKKWGEKEIDNKLRKEKGRFEIWLNKVNQIKLEFRQATELLEETRANYRIVFYEYPSITFESFQDLENTGSSNNTFFFSIRIYNNENNRMLQTFVFRFFRNHNKFGFNSSVIPLELNCFNSTTKDFLTIDKFSWSDRVRLRSFYFNDKGILTVIQTNTKKEIEMENPKISEIVENFFDDVFQYVLKTTEN